MIRRDTDIHSALLSRKRQRELVEGRGPRVNDFVINSYAGGGSPSGDPYWSSVVRALHFDGPNGSTTFTDEKGATWTGAGSGQISTAQSKFGGASLATGTGAYIDSAANIDYNLGTVDWTIDFWFYLTGGAGTRRAICGQSNNGGLNNTISIIVEVNASNALRLLAASGASLPVDVNGVTSLSLNTWYFGAVQRSGTIFSVWLNGTLENSSGSVSASINSSANRFAIGRPGEVASLYWPGYIDDFRMTKGVARYSSTFTPPTSAFPNF